VLDLRLDGREFDYRLVLASMGWLTVFGQANRLSISSSHQANSASYPQWDGNRISAKVRWWSAAGSNGTYSSFDLWINVWVIGKTVWSLVYLSYLSALEMSRSWQSAIQT